MPHKLGLGQFLLGWTALECVQAKSRAEIPLGCSILALCAGLGGDLVMVPGFPHPFSLAGWRNPSSRLCARRGWKGRVSGCSLPKSTGKIQPRTGCCALSPVYSWDSSSGGVAGKSPTNWKTPQLLRLIIPLPSSPLSLRFPSPVPSWGFSSLP